jgi:hypothetical protein
MAYQAISPPPESCFHLLREIGPNPGERKMKMDSSRMRQISVLPTAGSPVSFPLATPKTRIQARNPLPSAARRVTTHCFEMPLSFFQV